VSSALTAYVSEWEPLPEALARVMQARGLTREDAQAPICGGIADGSIKIRGKPGIRPVDGFCAPDTVLDGKDFLIPSELKPADFDWENSRPNKPWVVRRESFRPHGPWELEWIKLSRTDVTNRLCSGERQGEPGQVSGEPRAAVESTGSWVGAGLTLRRRPDRTAAKPARRRGPRAEKFERTVEAMRRDIQERRCSISELEAMLEKCLQAKYGVSRFTARRARDAVLSEMNLRQTPTNDK
jgi:hypothetical protein